MAKTARQIHAEAQRISEKYDEALDKLLFDLVEAKADRPENDTILGQHLNARTGTRKDEVMDMDAPVTVSCPTHGDFQVTPRAHLDGEGCPECERLDPTLRPRTEERARLLKAELLKAGMLLMT